MENDDHSTSHPAYLKINTSSRPVIPVSTRFQADLPDFTGPPDMGPSHISRLLGTKVWPTENISPQTTSPIGKGRPDFPCECNSPGSSECIEKHMGLEKAKLQEELGPAFYEWGFDGMGPALSEKWASEEAKKFESILRKPSKWKGGGFLKPALKALPNQKRETLVSYYYNIVVPRKIGSRIRLGERPDDVNTDDEEEKVKGAASRRSGRARKRSGTNETQSVKRMYLLGSR